jgi:Flp pilus assembly protein TadD
MELSESIAAFEKALALDPNAAENIAAFALSSLTTEQHASLRKLLEAHVESHPDSINTLYSLGVMSLRDGDTARARAYLERLARLVPDRAQVHYNLALVHQREGRAEEARKSLERFQALESEQRSAWLEGRRILDQRLEAKDALDRGDFETAVERFRLVLESDFGEVGDLTGLGTSLLGAGRPEEALSAFARALETDLGHEDALTGTANALEAMGRSGEAERYRQFLALVKYSCPDP